jgi:hypothetical protein
MLSENHFYPCMHVFVRRLLEITVRESGHISHVTYHIIYHMTYHMIYHVTYHMTYHVTYNMTYHLTYHRTYHMTYHLTFHMTYHVTYHLAYHVTYQVTHLQSMLSKSVNKMTSGYFLCRMNLDRFIQLSTQLCCPRQYRQLGHTAVTTLLF